MVGRAAPIPIAELRAVIVQIRAFERAQPPRAAWRQLAATAAFLTILLISLRAATNPAFLLSSNDFQENRMRSFAKAAVVSSIVAITSAAAAQNAVQWRVQDGGNGHWYATVPSNPASPDLVAFRVSVRAIGADLASIASQGENDFIRILGNEGNPTARLVLGGFTAAGPVQNWYWVDGTPWTFTAWNWNEPDSAPIAVHVEMLVGTWTPHGRWIDAGDCCWDTGGSKVAIEWSADCNDDGIVDYGQIRAGQLPDANGNNIPDCCENGSSCNCPGDTNNDRRVDGIDLATVLARWGMPGAKFPSADCNDDGLIDGIDLAIVLGGWGVCQ